ncbi:uncharacterized protein LOC134237985 [Saccostrea cucullata]|uniref:uncharacterized protein LOC134237985 n=1 Tax=Saccostrea cuccullata TaxID=36930 RepID=UPI002ED667B3
MDYKDMESYYQICIADLIPEVRKKERRSKMFHASKRLQAIRKQLKQINEQYKNTEAEFEQVTVTESEANMDKRNTNAYEISRARISNSGYSTAITINDLNEQVSSSKNNNVGADLGSLIECTSSEVAGLPLSEDLRCAILNMEDLDDVENVLGDVMNSVLDDTSFDKDLESIEQTGSFSTSSSAEHCHAQNTKGKNPSPENSTRKSETIAEEGNWREDRKKKDKHNIIERRRRHNINDRIKELASLLPDSVPLAFKQSKGSILKESVAYMKELMTKRQNLQKLKEDQKTMHSKYQKLLIRIFQLELKLKLYHSLSEEFDYSRAKRRKKPKKRLTEINAFVEDLVKAKDGAWLPNSKQKFLPPSKLILQQHFKNKTAEEGHSYARSDNSKSNDEFTDHVDQPEKQKKEQTAPLSHSAVQITEISKERNDTTSFPYDKADSGFKDEEGVLELSTEQCDILLGLFENNQNNNELILNTNFSPNPDDATASQGCFSPVTSTCNMLERLLRRQNSTSVCSSGSSGLEDSTESVTGLR